MPRRGEVWQVDFDPTQGDEIAKRRPAVVASSDAVDILALRIIVPLTEWIARYMQQPWFVRITATPQNGLAKVSADAFQVKSVSTSRFQRRLGSLTARQLDDIAAAIALCTDYTPENQKPARPAHPSGARGCVVRLRASASSGD